MYGKPSISRFICHWLFFCNIFSCPVENFVFKKFWAVFKLMVKLSPHHIGRSLSCWNSVVLVPYPTLFGKGTSSCWKCHSCYRIFIFWRHNPIEQMAGYQYLYIIGKISNGRWTICFMLSKISTFMMALRRLTVYQLAKFYQSSIQL